MGGGGGVSPPNVPTEANKSCTCNLYARASASDTYRPIFSGLKIHLHTIQSMQFPFIHLWYWAINDSIGQNTNIEGKSIIIRASAERASLENIFAFSHSKTAISFNILLVLLIPYLKNIYIYIFRSQMTSAYIYIYKYIYIHTINAVPCYYLCLVWRYINDSIPTKH